MADLKSLLIRSFVRIPNFGTVCTAWRLESLKFSFDLQIAIEPNEMKPILWEFDPGFLHPGKRTLHLG